MNDPERLEKSARALADTVLECSNDGHLIALGPTKETADLNDAICDYRDEIDLVASSCPLGHGPIDEDGTHGCPDDCLRVVAIDLKNALADIVSGLVDDHQSCVFCEDESWYGEGHTSACRVGIALETITRAEGAHRCLKSN